MSDKAHIPEFNNVAKIILRKFVDKSNDLYGSTFMSYNVHSLLHVADDSIYYGNLDNVSAFPFENFLGQMRRMIRGNGYEIEQVAKRAHEKENCLGIRSECVNSKFMTKKMIVKIYTKDNIIVSSYRSDCYFLLSTGEIIQVIQILSQNLVSCRTLISKKLVKYYPIVSSSLAIYEINLSNFRGLKTINVNNIISKYVVLPFSIDNPNVCICIPMVQMDLK